MTSMDDRNGGAPAASHGPFVVSHPCLVCHGQGAISEQACATCHGTGLGRFFHGTRGDLKQGNLIEPGHAANFGKRDRTTTRVYLTGTPDAAIRGGGAGIP
jgi:hypothetical protein